VPDLVRELARRYVLAVPASLPDLFRRDEQSGVSPPNLADTSSHAEHIVHARGKRTRFTSVSQSRDAIRDFDGEQLWLALRDDLKKAKHLVIEHEALLKGLRELLTTGSGDEKERAARALPRAKKRLEALVEWTFDISKVERKDLITWAAKQVVPFFKKAK
jgi:hypothetical protein